MTKTDRTATVHFAGGGDEDTVTAAQFEVENGWVLLSDANDEIVAAYPERRVASVKFRVLE